MGFTVDWYVAGIVRSNSQIVLWPYVSDDAVLRTLCNSIPAANFIIDGKISEVVNAISN